MCVSTQEYAFGYSCWILTHTHGGWQLPHLSNDRPDVSSFVKDNFCHLWSYTHPTGSVYMLRWVLPQTTLFLSPLSVTLAAREAPVKVPAPSQLLSAHLLPQYPLWLGVVWFPDLANFPSLYEVQYRGFASHSLCLVLSVWFLLVSCVKIFCVLRSHVSSKVAEESSLCDWQMSSSTPMCIHTVSSTCDTFCSSQSPRWLPGMFELFYTQDGTGWGLGSQLR